MQTFVIQRTRTHFTGELRLQRMAESLSENHKHLNDYKVFEEMPQADEENIKANCVKKDREAPDSKLKI